MAGTNELYFRNASPSRNHASDVNTCKRNLPASSVFFGMGGEEEPGGFVRNESACGMAEGSVIRISKYQRQGNLQGQSPGPGMVLQGQSPDLIPAWGIALVLIHILDCGGWLSEVPRKRWVKEGGSLAHLPMGCERMAASVPPFPTSLAHAGKMPALLEAGASHKPASRTPKTPHSHCLSSSSRGAAD